MNKTILQVPKLSMIYATDPNCTIGIYKNGKYTQPFHSKKDFAWFKKNTKDSAVIMGKRTFQDIISYSGKPLPNRLNIILSGSGYEIPKEIQEQDSIVDCALVSSIKEAMAHAISHGYKNIVFIGGKDIFEAVGHIVDEIFITQYDNYADVDKYSISYFPHHRKDLIIVNTEVFADTDTVTGEKLTGEFIHLKSCFPFYKLF